MTGAALALVCGAMLLAGILAAAQDAFPLRPIQLVVPQAPRGAADLHARPLAQVMERILRQPVVVVNKPGAGDRLFGRALRITRVVHRGR